MMVLDEAKEVREKKKKVVKFNKVRNSYFQGSQKKILLTPVKT